MTWSVEEIAERLQQAQAAVKQAELDEDLRELGFARALDAVGLGGAAAPPAPPPPPAVWQNGGGGDGDRQATGDGPIAAIAAQLELPVDTVGRVYREHEGQIQLAFKRAILPNRASKAASMREVSLLTATGRQASGIEDATSFAVMREECRAYGVLDSPNFAGEISKLDFRLSGGRNDRQATALRHHYEDAADLIGRMVGGPSS
jgi:hypothetical protein